jgi:hypothetical protein
MINVFGMITKIDQVIWEDLRLLILKYVLNLTTELRVVLACINAGAVWTDSDALSFISQPRSYRQDL